jgi:hypothetical protein
MSAEEKEQQLRILIDDSVHELAETYGWQADDLEEFLLALTDDIRSMEDDEEDDDA